MKILLHYEIVNFLSSMINLSLVILKMINIGEIRIKKGFVGFLGWEREFMDLEKNLNIIKNFFFIIKMCGESLVQSFTIGFMGHWFPVVGLFIRIIF